MEEEIGALVRKCAAQVFAGVMEGLDEWLLATRSEDLEVEGFRTKTLVTTFGELSLKRRLYKDKTTGEWRFLLDERLGLEKGARVSPKMRELAAELSVEVPFRRAAEILGKAVPHVSAMTVWNAAKEAGEKARAEGRELRERVFDQGVVPGGTRKAELLNIEADGVLVGAQKCGKKREEIKLGVAYEGKKAKGSRVGLVERRVVAGVTKDKEFWEETSAALGEHWDLSSVKGVLIGTDGAGWGRTGVEYFDKATYQLDKFHLKKAMREALGHDPEGYEAVAGALMSRDREKVVEALREAGRRVSGKKRQGIREFEVYVLGNWDGIMGNTESLGTIEGQVYHHLARRMKRQGARWTPEGADRMARLLAAKANGELSKYSTPSAPTSRPVSGMQMIASTENIDHLDRKAEEIGAWLRARVPALQGPYQGRGFIKHVLRQIVLATECSL